MSNIRIYKREYTLPTLSNDQFIQLQKNIRLRQQLIKEGQRSSTLFKRSQPISFDERFDELKKLVQDYETIIEVLKTHKEAYEVFFIELSDEVRVAVAEKCAEIFQIEQERLELEHSDITQHDNILLEKVKTQQDQLFRSIRLLGQAALLILKKIELFKTSLERLAEDQSQQKEVLDKMVIRLNHYYKAYELQKRIKRIEADVAEMANIAVNFEEFMREYLGPFQQLIEQVTEIDHNLSGTVNEIKTLTEMMLHENGDVVTLRKSEQFQDQLLEFLIKSHVKRERLVEVVQQAQFSNSFPEVFELELAQNQINANSISVALDNIKIFVDVQLQQQCIGDVSDRIYSYTVVNIQTSMIDIIKDYKTDKETKIFIAPDIDQKKLMNFICNTNKALKIELNPTEVLVYNDYSLLGSGKEGLAITDKHLIVNCGQYKYIYDLNAIDSITKTFWTTKITLKNANKEIDIGVIVPRIVVEIIQKHLQIHKKVIRN